MKEKSNNRKERTTVSNYPPPPHPVKKRFLAFLFAAALSAAFVGCNLGDAGSMEYAGDNTVNGPGVKKPDNPSGNNTGNYTVSYQTGNGTGKSWSETIDKNEPILTLPNEKELEPAGGTAVFVGWSDGMLTYPAAYEYTVTKDVTFQARWAFDKLAEIENYLTNASDPALIAVAGGVQPNDGITSLTWKNLLLVIESACKTGGKTVELDLSGSTLALFGTDNNEFDYMDDTKEAYGTGEKYIKKLILPSNATSITNVFYNGGPFLKLEAVSGLNVSAIPDDAFRDTSTLAAVAFPAAETIGLGAFHQCVNLTSVSLPAATSIGNSAFYICEELTEVSLPMAETIGELAFGGCSNLTSVNLPMAETIGELAFSGCVKLTSVSLSAAKSIGDLAFDGCSNLTSITIAEGCGINENSYIPNGFKTYYEQNNGYGEKAAGVYTYSDPNWNYAPLEENS